MTWLAIIAITVVVAGIVRHALVHPDGGPTATWQKTMDERGAVVNSLWHRGDV